MWYSKVKQCGWIVKAWSRGTVFLSWPSVLGFYYCIPHQLFYAAYSTTLYWNNPWWFLALLYHHTSPFLVQFGLVWWASALVPKTGLLFCSISQSLNQSAWKLFKGSNDCNSHMEWRFCPRLWSGVGVKASHSSPFLPPASFLSGRYKTKHKSHHALPRAFVAWSTETERPRIITASKSQLYSHHLTHLDARTTCSLLPGSVLG